MKTTEDRIKVLMKIKKKYQLTGIESEAIGWAIAALLLRINQKSEGGQTNG